MNSSPAEFYFELSANGEQTSFQEVEGVSTEVVLPGNLRPGENPFSFRLPSLPKTNNLVLKHGKAKTGSKLLQWCAQAKNSESKVEKSRATLTIKDKAGKPLLEWTLFSACPKNSKVGASGSKSAETVIEDLELAYSFFTLSKK
jgi:phage tail-like protein